MAGQVLRIVKRQILTGGTNIKASALGAETVLVSNIRTADWKYLNLIVRLHSATWGGGTGAKCTFRLRNTAPTDEDPVQSFQSTAAALVTTDFTSPQAAPFAQFPAQISDFGPFVNLTFEFFQGTTVDVTHTLNISADLVLRSS